MNCFEDFHHLYQRADFPKMSCCFVIPSSTICSHETIVKLFSAIFFVPSPQHRSHQSTRHCQHQTTSVYTPPPCHPSFYHFGDFIHATTTRSRHSPTYTPSLLSDSTTPHLSLESYVKSKKKSSLKSDLNSPKPNPIKRSHRKWEFISQHVGLASFLQREALQYQIYRYFLKYQCIYREGVISLLHC
jgi:hypothetical protein